MSAAWVFCSPLKKKNVCILSVFAGIHDIFQPDFNKTFCICHRNGDTKPEKLLTLFMWQASKALHNMTATTAWRASEESSLYLLLLSAFLGPCHLSRLFPFSYLYHIFSFLLSSFGEPSVGMSQSPSVACDECRIPGVYATPPAAKANCFYPSFRDINFPQIFVWRNHPDRWPIKSALGAQNELKCAHRCIPFQNQYLYGKYLLKQQAQESAPAPDAPSERRKRQKYCKKIYTLLYILLHWQDKTRWWLSFFTLSPLQVQMYKFKFFSIFHCGWGVCVGWEHMLWRQHETNRCQE